MKVIRQSLALALTLGAAAALHGPAAQAQTVTPNPAPTIITTAPYTISSAGYYQLGANLSVTNLTGAIITVNANNVTLDFGGHFISGPTNAVANSTLTGVQSNDHTNITVQNGTIANCYEGILFYGSNNGTMNYNQLVRNMLVTFCSHVGVNFQSAQYSRVMDNVISNIGGASATNGTGNYGIYGQGLYSSFSGNVIATITGPAANSSSAYCIYVPSGYDAIVVRNQLSNSYFGLYFDDSGKYQDNLSLNTTTAFSGGTDAGGNN